MCQRLRLITKRLTWSLTLKRLVIIDQACLLALNHCRRGQGGWRVYEEGNIRGRQGKIAVQIILSGAQIEFLKEFFLPCPYTCVKCHCSEEPFIQLMHSDFFFLQNYMMVRMPEAKLCFLSQSTENAPKPADLARLLVSLM